MHNLVMQQLYHMVMLLTDQLRCADGQQYRKENHAMSTIGQVRKKKDGSFEGQLRTLSVQAPLLITPVKGKKSSESAPDFRITSDGVEIGAGWLRTGQVSQKEYVSCSLTAPELASLMGKGKAVYANLGRAADQDDPEVYSLIWNP